ncbi:MAG: TM0996/MTH895 family glutaredoxin-like protein [Acidobacteria bacterium]|nr:TM0996/MTH895 family glutaredoxin-like protein [Acidobacteriota bacterium]
MKIQILGTGCAKCQQLTENAKAAAAGLGLDYEVEKVTDIVRIIEFGVMATPALAVDGKVKLAGKVASPAALAALAIAAATPGLLSYMTVDRFHLDANHF